MPEQENYCIPFNQIQVQVILVACTNRKGTGCRQTGETFPTDSLPRP